MSRIAVQTTPGHSAGSKGGRSRSLAAAAAVADIVPGQFSELDW